METLQQSYKVKYEQHKPMREELQKLLYIKSCIDMVLRRQEPVSQKCREIER